MGFLFGGAGKPRPPTPAPPAPVQNNPVLNAVSFTRYKALRQQSGVSYARSAMGGSAPNPVKSYAAGLFSTPKESV
jgi:hypothetical protein